MNGLEKSISDIRIRFLERLRNQHAELIELAGRFESQSEPFENCERVQMIAHKIAGLAKSVGFEALGTAAFLLDQAIIKSNKTGHRWADDNELSRRVTTLIDECERALQQ